MIARTMLLAGFALTAAAATAQAPVAATHTSTAKTTTTTTTAKPVPAPAKSVQATHVTHTTVKATPGGRMVTTKTKTGKTITYDCSKAGNASKAACKK